MELLTPFIFFVLLPVINCYDSNRFSATFVEPNHHAIWNKPYSYYFVFNKQIAGDSGVALVPEMLKFCLPEKFNEQCQRPRYITSVVVGFEVIGMNKLIGLHVAKVNNKKP